MKARSIIVFIQIAALAVLLGCRPVVDVKRPGDYGWYPGVSSYFSATFESFWSGMNVNYVFWDLEPTDYWDNIWNTYKPKFDALPSDDAAKGTAYDYFKEMLRPLHDGHLSVYFDIDNPLYKEYNHGDDRVDARDRLDDNPKWAFWSNWTGNPSRYNSNNYNITNTIKNYVTFNGNIEWITPDTGTTAPDNFRIATGRIPITGTVSDFILYFYFSSFDIAENATKYTDIDNIVKKYLDDIAEQGLEGVILDLRGNTGGSNTDIDLVLNRLIHEPLLFAYTRYKNGPNRLDYKPWMPYYIYPHSESLERDVPVVALINDYSISCGELAPMAVRSMPKGYLIGTRTWGATGPRFGDDSPAALNGGSFSNRNGLTFWQEVTQAGFQTKGADGTNYEGVGIRPDDEVPFKLSEFYLGRDRQLETAISKIDTEHSPWPL